MSRITTARRSASDVALRSGLDFGQHQESGRGWKGVMEITAGSALPEKYPSIAGSVFPVWHVLADVGEFRGSQVLPCISSRPLDIECLVLKSGSRTRMLVANLSTERQTIELRASGQTTLRLLDGSKRNPR